MLIATIGAFKLRPDLLVFTQKTNDSTAMLSRVAGGRRMSAPHENNKSVMDIFVTRPLLAIVLSLLIIIAGIYSSTNISVQQFPRIESTSLVINTVYTGASAEIVKGYITEPIERVASTVPGVDYVDSVTMAGSSKVTAWLDLNYDSTAALAELSAQLGQIKFELPQGAQDPAVSIVRADRTNALFYLSIESGDVPRSKVTDYFSRNVIPILSDIGGVQKVTLKAGAIQRCGFGLSQTSSRCLTLVPIKCWPHYEPIIPLRRSDTVKMVDNVLI